MKRVAWLFVVAVLLAGCADDIVVEQSGDLRGYYTGEFIIVENYGSGSGAITTDGQYINWTFTDQRFYLEVDTARTLDVEICDFSGYYELGTSMQFDRIQFDVGLCKPEFVAEGEFTFITKRIDNAPDTLFFEQLEGPQGDQILKTIILVKDEEE